MTSLANNLNGITSGTAVTAGNSGGTSGSAFGSAFANTGATCTADSAAAYEGACGLQLTYSSASTSGYVSWSISAAAGVRLSGSFFFKFSTMPSVLEGILTIASTNLKLTTTGQIEATSVSTVDAATPALSTNKWYYIEWAFTVGTTSSNGRSELNVYDAATGYTLLKYDSGTTLNTGSSTATILQIGRAFNAASSNTLRYDLLAADNTLSTGFPGASKPAYIGGSAKAYISGSFQAKPAKIWTGSAWVQKPVKRWNGSSWVTTSY